jgi:predicted amidohydrolase
VAGRQGGSRPETGKPKRMIDLRIAMVCMHSVLDDMDGNMGRIARFVETAAREGAHMICFPEAAVTGYALKEPEKYCSVQDTRLIMDRLIQMGRDVKMVLIVGLVENSGEGKPYIAQLITGPEGLIGIHRKTHLSPTESEIYGAGDTLGVFVYGGWCFGLQLCYEAHFPEISTKMALSGADLLLIPHASPRGDPAEKFESWMRHLPARAFDNGVFITAVNPVGENGGGLSFPGVSLVLGPDGRLIRGFHGKEEKVLFAVLKGETLKSIRQHRMKYFLPKRRPGLYR